MTSPPVLLNLPTSPPLRVSVILSPTVTLQDLGPEEHIVCGNQERKHKGKVDYWAVTLLYSTSLVVSHYDDREWQSAISLIWNFNASGRPKASKT